MKFSKSSCFRQTRNGMQNKEIKTEIRSLQSFVFSLVAEILFFNRGSVSLTEVNLLYKSGAFYL